MEGRNGKRRLGLNLWKENIILETVGAFFHVFEYIRLDTWSMSVTDRQNVKKVNFFLDFESKIAIFLSMF